MFQSRNILTALTLTLTILGCTNPGYVVPKIHKIDIQQGNVVTRESLEQIQPGMNKQQVSLLLGTPLVVDAFHSDRWDYVYTLEAGHSDVEKNHIAILFADNQVSQVFADINSDFYIDQRISGAQSVEIDVPPRPPENRTLVQKIKNFFTF